MADSKDARECRNCEHLVFSDCYGECLYSYITGPVTPWDTCEHFERRRPYNKHFDLHTEH